MNNEVEVMADLIRTNLMAMLAYESIRPTEYSPLTPYQQELAKLCEKYGVPSPVDRGIPNRPAPEIPPGKIQNA